MHGSIELFDKLYEMVEKIRVYGTGKGKRKYSHLASIKPSFSMAVGFGSALAQSRKLEEAIQVFTLAIA